MESQWFDPSWHCICHSPYANRELRIITGGISTERYHGGIEGGLVVTLEVEPRTQCVGDAHLWISTYRSSAAKSPSKPRRDLLASSVLSIIESGHLVFRHALCDYQVKEPQRL